MAIDRELAAVIDHTLLKAEATTQQIERLCDESIQYGFATVCVNSSYVPLCVRRLEGSRVKVCSVVGFPLGAMATEIKAAEAAWAVEQGADEIDMVMAVGRFLSERVVGVEYVVEDIRAVVRAAEGRTVKVILETGLLPGRIGIRGACALALSGGARYVKTSTGFGPGGATVEDVRLMRQNVGPKDGVKASGGIRNREKALKLIEAGATRIGASASVALVTLDG